MKKNLFPSLLPAACFIFVSLSAFSEINPVDKIVSELFYEKDSPITDEKTEKPFSSSFGIEHINGFINSADRINQFFLIGSYKFLETWSFSLSQNVNQHYFRNPNSNDKGVWIQDTLFSLKKKFKNPSGKSSFTTGVSSTLPLSYYSQVNDIWTVSTAYFTWRLNLDSFITSYKPDWIKDISFSVKPIARYYFSEYTTTPTEGQSLGGVPLPELLMGIQKMSLTANIRDRFSLTGSYGRWWISTYKIANDDYDYKRYLQHFYFFSFIGSVKIQKHWKLSFSYSHIDRMDKQGRFETVFLDDRLSTWSLSVVYSLSFENFIKQAFNSNK